MVNSTPKFHKQCHKLIKHCLKYFLCVSQAPYQSFLLHHSQYVGDTNQTKPVAISFHWHTCCRNSKESNSQVSFKTSWASGFFLPSIVLQRHFQSAQLILIRSWDPHLQKSQPGTGVCLISSASSDVFSHSAEFSRNVCLFKSGKMLLSEHLQLVTSPPPQLQLQH